MSTAVGSPADLLATLPAGVPDLTLGYEAIDWAEQWLIQPNGPRARKPFELTRGQGRFLLWWYAVDPDGAWLFNHAARRLAKGSGKSPFAAVLALIEFLAPVRLDNFDPKWPGGCVGKPVDMPLVQVAATAESQTANTMRMIRAFCPKRSKLVEAYNIDVGKTQFYRLPEATLEVVTSSYTAAEGAEPTFVVEDETEHWRPSNGGVLLASTLDDNLAKSGARSLETNNAWVPGMESVAEDTWDAWLAQEEGRTRGDTKILYDAVIAPADTDLADPVSLRAALEWVYADCPWVDVAVIMERIWSPKAKADESKRKYCNRPSVSEDAWTSPEDWAVLTDATRVVARREPIVMFFDGSKSEDATALIGCCMSDGHVFTLDIWEPAKDRVVPVADVDLAVAQAFENYTVVAFFADVREWESFVKVTWPADYADQLEIMAVPQGKDPQSIAWDMRGHTYDFTQACELVEAEITGGVFTHDGDSRLARHVGNARRKPNRWGVSIGKESPSSPRKIDGCVGMIGARMVRRLAIAAGAGKKKRSGLVW